MCAVNKCWTVSCVVSTDVVCLTISHLLDIQKKERRTTIIVTHDWEEAVALADRFFWIEDGRVKVSGDKSGLIEYKDTYFSESK